MYYAWLTELYLKRVFENRKWGCPEWHLLKAECSFSNLHLMRYFNQFRLKSVPFGVPPCSLRNLSGFLGKLLATLLAKRNHNQPGGVKYQNRNGNLPWSLV